MAENNPMGDTRLVSLDLPAEHAPFLRDEITGWLGSLRSDLKAPERLKDLGRTRRQAEAVERLLVALTARQVLVPDADAEAFLRAAAESHDEESGYAEVVAAHDAMHGLLAAVQGT